MADDIKRLNYFTGQFLAAPDFGDEQTYHKEMRWRGNQALFGPGVRIGLDVSATASKQAITVGPGIALDEQGRELVVLPAQPGTAPAETGVPVGLAGQVVYVVASYGETLTDSHSIGGYTGATRVTEAPVVVIQAAAPTAAQILLATLQLDADGTIAAVDRSVRQASPLWLEPGNTIMGKGRLHIHGEELLFLLNKSGVVVGKEWGGNGNLIVEGQLNVSADVVVGTGADGQNRRLVFRGPNSPTGPASAQDISFEFAAAGSAKLRAHRGGSWGTSLQLLTNSPATGADQPAVRLHIDESGDVGIGTTQPESALHVASALGIKQNSLHLSGGAGGSSLSYNAHRNRENTNWVFPDPTRAAVTLEIDDGLDSGKTRLDVFTTTTNQKTTWVHRLRVDGETGNLGIGTGEPQARLHVRGDAGLFNLEGTTHAYLQWYPKGFASGRKAVIGYLTEGDATSGAMTIRNDGGRMHVYGEEILFLLNKSGVRIGKEWGGSGTLSVAGAVTAEASLTVNGTLTAGSDAGITRNLTVGSNLTVGNTAVVSNTIGIKTGTPQAPLHIHQNGETAIRLDDPTGAVNFRIYYENDNRTVVFYHYDANDQRVSGQFIRQDGKWQQFSDARLKTHVVELSGMLDKVMQLRPVSFDWIANGIPDIGFVAQDVEQVFPELVSESSPEGDRPVKGLPYTTFAVLAIAALKEMKREYDARIGALEESANERRAI